MRTIRRRLSWLFALTLAMQLAAIVAPVVLSAADPDFAEMCTCPGGIHATSCPMHHGKPTPPPDSSNHCAIRSASVPTDLALLTLVSGAGIIPPLTVFSVTEESSVFAPAANPTFVHRTDRPDSPPPRA